ncbi:MAG: LamG-like jellyroll fold domain-containing protein [Pirellula sp.]
MKFLTRTLKQMQMDHRNRHKVNARNRFRNRLVFEHLETRALLAAVAAPSGLVSWWTADNTVADLLTRNNAAINTTSGNSAPTYAAGKVGQALKFDGVNDRAILPDSASLQLTESLSIEGWIRIDSFPTTGSGLILFRGDHRGGLDPYSIAVMPNGSFSFQISDLNNSLQLEAPVSTGEFIHVAATLDDASGAMRIYVNGVLTAETVTDIRPFQSLSPSNNPGIGIGNHGGDLFLYNYPFHGLIDELSVYNRALSAAEVKAINDAGIDGKIKMVVTTTTPDLGGISGTPLTNFVVNFSSPINAASLTNTDLKVNGISADSVTLNDADTATFSFLTSPVTTQGLQTLHMDAEAVTRSSDGLKLAVYDATFRYDATVLSVVSTTPAIGGPLNVSRLNSVTTAVASMAGMDGANGGWPVLYGASPVGSSGMKLAIDEDELLDIERSHTSEQLAFLALEGTPTGNTAPYLRTGIVSGVSNSWTTVTLDRSYASMVVMATPNYDITSVPLVTRLRTVDGSSQFQVKVDRADGLSGAVTGVKVQYVVVEAGVYTQATHGVKLEAVRFNSTVTDSDTAWLGESRSYSNIYTNPVVIGQVMSANDPAFSVFWARGADRTSAPSATSLYVGKHVGEDPIETRANETIGYIVMEAGGGTIGGAQYLAAVGVDSVSGIGDSPSYSTYTPTLATLRVDFNETIDQAKVGQVDLILDQGVVISAAVVDGDTVEYTMTGVSSDLWLNMASGAITDQFGNPMAAYSAKYHSGITKFHVVNDGTSDSTYEYGRLGDTLVTGRSLSTSAGNTLSRGIATTASREKIWVIDANKKVYVYRASDNVLLGSWTASGLQQPEGITTNGTDIWILDGKLGRVFKYAGAASTTSGTSKSTSNFSLPTTDRLAGPAKDLVTDGNSIWVVRQFDSSKPWSDPTVLKYTLSGQLIASWWLGDNYNYPTGITLDPANPDHLWIVDNVTRRVYQYNHATYQGDGGRYADSFFDLHVGNTNPQGIADPPPPSASLNTAPGSDVRNRASSNGFMQAPIVSLGVLSTERVAQSQSVREVTECVDEFMSQLASSLPIVPISMNKVQSTPLVSRIGVAKDRSFNLALTDEELSDSLHAIADDLVESKLR